MMMMTMMRNRRNKDHRVSPYVQDALCLVDLGYRPGSGFAYGQNGYLTGPGSFCGQSDYANASDSVFCDYRCGLEIENDNVSRAAGLCCSYEVSNHHIFASPHDFSSHRDSLYHDCPYRGGAQVSRLDGFQALSVLAQAWEHRRFSRTSFREGHLARPPWRVLPQPLLPPWVPQAVPCLWFPPAGLARTPPDCQLQVQDGRQRQKGE
jgi:hypothetical protein